MMNPKRILVIGLGNPILGDDGVGWQVGEQIQSQIRSCIEGNLGNGFTRVDVECAAEGGLRLMELMVGYDYAVVVDALVTGEKPQGAVTCIPLEALPDYTVGHVSSPHNTTLQTAMRLGRELDLHLPRSVTIIGIEAR